MLLGVSIHVCVQSVQIIQRSLLAELFTAVAMPAPGTASTSASGGAQPAAHAALPEPTFPDANIPEPTFPDAASEPVMQLQVPTFPDTVPDALPAQILYGPRCFAWYLESDAIVETSGMPVRQLEAAEADLEACQLAIKSQLLEAIARCQARIWTCSVECKNLIHVMLACSNSARSLSPTVALQLRQFLDVSKGPEEAFFDVLDNPDDIDETAVAITEYDLRKAVMNFLAKWSAQVLATYEDLIKDTYVHQVTARCLPESVSLYAWIAKRMSTEVYFSPKSIIEIMITPEGALEVEATYRKIWKSKSLTERLYYFS